MKRRQFLTTSALSLSAFAVPSMVNQAFANDIALQPHLANNPLLEFKALPNFAKVQPKHVKPAIDYIVAYAKEVIQYIGNIQNPTWQNFYLPLQNANNKLRRAWHIVNHLNYVANNDSLRKAYSDADTVVTDYYTWSGMYRPLYEGFVKLKNSSQYSKLNKAQKKAIDNALRDFELSGIALTGEKAVRYKEINNRLSELSTKFSDNVLDSTAAFDLVITDENELEGLSQAILEGAEQSAKSKGKQGYRFTLDYSSYGPFMTYANNRDLRKKMYEARITRSSDQGPNAGKYDNAPVITEILSLRHELAQLMGYQTYAHYALVTRMAKSPETVMSFLNQLITHARPKAVEEMADLQNYGKQFGIDEMMPWDIGYLSEKQKNELYSVDSEKIREYFPEDKVFAGLFEIANRVFNITVTEADSKKANAWHEDVRFFNVHRDGKYIASFYTDIYAHENKRGGAWMSSAVGRVRLSDGQLQLPVAQIVCNFSKPVGDKPSLLLHNEVTTLFHEFGHAIHLMLTQIDVLSVSGISGVPWDAVEFPSQLLENWTWDKDSLKLISSHYETGETLPDDLIDKMMISKNYHQARSMVRQLGFGLFDFRLHLEYDPSRDNLAIMREDIRQNVSVVNDPKWGRFENNFNHIFSGGYAAGYYGYLWSDVLSSDAYSRFEKEGIYNPATGQAYIDAFLGQGGSDEPMNMFVKFMGRQPNPNALLISRGIL